MDRFMVMLPHTAADCKKALKQIESIGAITHFDWGCMDADHTGYATFEAKNKAEALLFVPSSQRNHARVVQLTKFSPEQVKAMHE